MRDVSIEPAIDAKNLLRWLIFNYLAGNSDGHAKNLSFIYTRDEGIRLSLFYDLVCTHAIERIDTHLSFKIGGTTDPGQINKKHWSVLAEECEIGKRYLFNLVEDTADRLISSNKIAKGKFEEKYGGYRALDRIDHIITAQCRRALKTFRE